MTKDFPTVGVVGASHLARMSIAPATALGVNLVLLATDSNDPGAQITTHIVGDHTDLETVKAFAKKCDVVTFDNGLIPLSIIKSLEVQGILFRPSSQSLIGLEHSKFQHNADSDELFDYEITVLVARSPHGQATTWAPTQKMFKDGKFIMSITPAPGLNAPLSEQVQKVALDIAAEIGAAGVMAVDIQIKDEQLFLNRVSLHPHDIGNWTIEGSRTSQFEQHLRAILDLPLGDPAMTAQYVVVGNIVCGEKTDMYRPYLHLMARTPALKFHQYKNEAKPGAVVGHVTLLGDDVNLLIHEVQHALDYLSAQIDE